MATFHELIIPAAVQVRNYTERLLAEIPPLLFSSKPRIEGMLIETNHPAFIVGHLCLYPARIMTLLGRDTAEFLPPEPYPGLFVIGTACHDDPDQKIYPHKDELVSFLLEKTDRVLELLPSISDDQMSTVNVEERSKDRFPLVGSFVMYLLTAHPNGHLGQISAWRRCMGLGPV